jgi:beta-galactosidase GanA
VDLLEVLNGCKNFYSVHLPYPHVGEIEFKMDANVREQMAVEVIKAAAHIFTRVGDWQAGVHGENGHTFMRFEAFIFSRDQLFAFAEKIYNAGLVEGRGATLLPAQTELVQ